MPRLVQNITSESNQRHTLLFNDIQVDLFIRFNSQVSQWFIDVKTGSKSVYGVKLSVGPLHINSRNMPCDFIVKDASLNGIDSFKQDDFSEGRCILYLLDDQDMIKIRGQRVKS